MILQNPSILHTLPLAFAHRCSVTKSLEAHQSFDSEHCLKVLLPLHLQGKALRDKKATFEALGWISTCQYMLAHCQTLELYNIYIYRYIHTYKYIYIHIITHRWICTYKIPPALLQSAASPFTPCKTANIWQHTPWVRKRGNSIHDVPGTCHANNHPLNWTAKKENNPLLETKQATLPPKTKKMTNLNPPACRRALWMFLWYILW